MQKLSFLILLILGFIPFHSLKGANPDIQKLDSLQQALEMAEDPGPKIDLMLEIASELGRHDPEKSLEYCRKALRQLHDLQRQTGQRRGGPQSKTG